MADDQDEIRAKRLARMAGSGASVSSTSLSSSTSAGSNSGNTVASSQPPAPKIKSSTAIPTPPSSSPKASSPQAASPATAASSAALKIVHQFLNVSDEIWEHQTIAFIFQIELDPSIAQTKKYTHLPSLSEDLISDGLPSRFSSAVIDRALHSRLSLSSNADPSATPLFDYLVSTWKLCLDVRRRINSVVERMGSAQLTPEQLKTLNQLVQKRSELVDSAKALAVSYAGLVVTPGMAESFPQRDDVIQRGSGWISSKLLLDPFASEEALPKIFFDEFVARFDGDGLDEILGSLVNGVIAHMRTQNITSDYMASIRALSFLVGYKPIASLLTTLPNWCPANIAPRTIEVLTILGPILSKSSIFPDPEGKIPQTYFASSNAFAEDENYDNYGFGIGSRNYGDVKSAMESLRHTSASVQNTLHSLFMTLIKTGPETRDAVLNFLATSLSINHARGKMQVDRNTVSTDGFLFNIVKVCLKLCEPIMDSTYSKIHLIDPYHFLHPNPRIVPAPNTTLINADSEQLEEARKNFTPTAPNFVTEAFSLTLSAHHYGLLSSMRWYSSLIKDVGELRNQIARLKQERDQGVWSRAPDGPLKEHTLKRMQTQLDMIISYKLMMETALLDSIGIEQSMRFFNLVMVWLVRVILVGSSTLPPPVRPGGPDSVDWGRIMRGDAQGLPLTPLPQDVPTIFATLPEWIIEDIVEFYLFICKNKAILLEGTPRDELMAFSIAILKSPNYIKNPYLKSKLVEIMFFFTVPLYRTPNGERMGPRLDTVFGTHPFAKEHLVSSLMRYYVYVENTGSRSAFYDKFNIRYHIAQIMKVVWEDMSHRARVIEESRNVDEFVKFVNMLMNDTTYLLDESLNKLTEIHKIQEEMADVTSWNALPEATRNEREANLNQFESHAQSLVTLGNETVHMFQYMTAEEQIVTPFMAPYIVERLAAMLDYNLEALVGPRCTELKVKNPEKYDFKPKVLLTKLIDIFLNLSHRPEFVQAVAKDGRSYKKETFARAADIMNRHMLKNPSDLQKLAEFVEKVETHIKNELAEEEELGEIPDEFLDPLLATLMEDPVILPTSNMTIDRSTIITQLLSTPIDPFNRKPLTIDMVIPNVELKQQIDDWKKKSKSSKMQVD